MKIKKCTICGTEFESHNGNQVCSENCRLERKKLQDAKANQRRKNGISNSFETKQCPICRKTFEALPNRIYCSKECYFKSKQKMDKENFKIYYSDYEWKRRHIEKVKSNKKN